MTNLTTVVVMITPEMASQMLEKNAGNRQINWRHVHALARDMSAGRWQLTHQGIAFGPDGNVVDGQHRLEAIRLSGVPCEMLVSHYGTIGVVTAASVVMDSNVVRGSAFAAHITKQAAGVINMIVAAISGSCAIRLQAAETMAIADKLRPLLTATTKTTQIYGVAPVRAAAILRTFRGRSPNYSIQQYQALTSRALNKVSGSVQTLNLWLETRAKRGSLNGDRYATLRGAYVCFDPSNRNLQVLRESKSTPGEMREIAKEIVRGAGVDPEALQEGLRISSRAQRGRPINR